MKIAQVAPLYESVPPAKYGGTERVVSYLTEELVRQGHEVTLFASGDSQSRAHLVPGCERALRTDPKCHDPLACHIVMIEEVYRRISDFDVVHFHIDYVHFPVSSRTDSVHLTTLHGRLDLPELPSIYKIFPEEPVISISRAQRAPLPRVNWLATVHHGLPSNLYRACGDHEPYLAFVGRISPEKGLDKAIEIARRAGMPLCIAAKVDKADREYFETSIKPLLNDSSIEFLDEVGDKEKQRIIGRAAALLFPIDWPEPFGLVMIEAMACGTPVIAFRRGSVPEIVDHGATGFVVDNVDRAVEAVQNLSSFSRALCRQVFKRRFSATRMALDYLKQYEALQNRQEYGASIEVHPCL
ncbi:MAG: glycosyltransferase family 4 protein [Bryobacteraceae bacterium]